MDIELRILISTMNLAGRVEFLLRRLANKVSDFADMIDFRIINKYGFKKIYTWKDKSI